MYKIQSIYDEVVNVPRSAREDLQHRANNPTGRRKTSEFSIADISCDVISTQRLVKKKNTKTHNIFFFRSKIQRYVNCLASISNKQCEITQKLNNTFSIHSLLFRGLKAYDRIRSLGEQRAKPLVQARSLSAIPPSSASRVWFSLFNKMFGLVFFILEEVILNKL